MAGRRRDDAERRHADHRIGGERNITRQSLIYVELTRTIEPFFYVSDPHIDEMQQPSSVIQSTT
jgi:hypothetical protein